MMTTLEEATSLHPKLLHNLETHYHNVEKLYNDNLSREEIREELQIPYEDWMPMDDVIFAIESVHRSDNVFGENLYYRHNSLAGKAWEIKDEKR